MVVGTVLGLTVSVATNVLGQRQSSLSQDVGLRIEEVRLLAEVMERVRREYVDAVDDRELIESAIRGMISELDAHSRYLAPEEYEDIRINTTGNYSGVGLDVSVEDGKVTVVTPLDDTPAQRAGILPGDVLISVDDMPVNASNVETTVDRMRGTPGTPVTVDVVRDGEVDPLHFALTRARIQVTTVRSEYLGGGFGYIKLTGFSESTAADLAKAAEELRRRARSELTGVVLDLRNNPGGVLSSAVEVADAFLENGLIVRGSGRARDARFEQYARPGDILNGAKLVVLVNGGSASASEIVAGALKDHHRADVVGQRTFGKGSVQTVMPLSDGRAIKLTTSRYLTPSGRSINGTGVEPDFVVAAENPRHLYRGPGSAVAARNDNQLRQALRVIGFSPVELSRAP